MKKICIQVVDEQNACKFDEEIVDVPDEMFFAPGSTVLTIEGVKTAIDYHLNRLRKASPR